MRSHLLIFPKFQLIRTKVSSVETIHLAISGLLYDHLGLQTLAEIIQNPSIIGKLVSNQTAVVTASLQQLLSAEQPLDNVIKYNKKNRF